MTKYLKSNILALSAILFVSFSCTKVNDNLGAGMIAPDDRVTIKIDTLDTGFSIRSVQPDSMLTDNSTSYYLGSTVFPRMGRLNASFVTQIIPGELPADKVFPSDIVVDSAYVIIDNDGYIGMDGYELELKMYELKKKLPNPKDSSYFSNFPIRDYIDSEPDFSQMITAGDHTSHMKVPVEYVEKYIRATKEQNTDEELFHDTFFGYYFETGSAFGTGALWNVSPNSSGIKIYYHTPEEPEKAKAYNLSFAHITNDASTGTQTLVNEGFVFFDRDYSYIDPVFGFDPLSTEKSYVMGCMGLITEITISEDIINGLKSKGTAESPISFLRAELILPLNEPTIGTMDDALSGVGLYYNYQDFKFMPSYKPDASTGSVSSSYGGGLNRAKKAYTMDISSYLQRLISGDAKNNVIQVAPYVTDRFTFKSTELANTPENPIKLAITYLDRKNSND